MPYSIHLVSVRKSLKLRKEPYWAAPLQKGRYLGIRVLTDGTFTWIARLRDDDGKQKYRSLGQISKDYEYSHAKKDAESWFSDFDVGVIRREKFTVGDACREYVSELRAEGREKTAIDAEQCFSRIIYGHDIAKMLVNKIRTSTIKAWRNGLQGSKAYQNRRLTNLRAALNLAVQNDQVNPAVAKQWRSVKPHVNADGRRDVFLNLQQRRAFLNATDGGLRDLIEAHMLTGARPGEIVNAKRSQFHENSGSLTLAGKTGTRTIPLSPNAEKLFSRLAKDKLPAAYLLLRDDGVPWLQCDWTRYVRGVVKDAGLPKGTVLYTLRHSFITEALLSGMATLDVAKITGTSLSMIEKHYGHLVAEATRERLSCVEMV